MSRVDAEDVILESMPEDTSVPPMKDPIPSVDPKPTPATVHIPPITPVVKPAPEATPPAPPHSPLASSQQAPTIDASSGVSQIAPAEAHSASEPIHVSSGQPVLQSPFAPETKPVPPVATPITTPAASMDATHMNSPFAAAPAEKVVDHETAKKAAIMHSMPAVTSSMKASNAIAESVGLAPPVPRPAPAVPPKLANAKPTLADALKPLVKQAMKPKGPSMVASLVVMVLTVVIALSVGLGIRLAAPTLIDWLTEYTKTFNLVTFGVQTGPALLVALVLLLLSWWWGRNIQIMERRAIIGFLWGVSLYALITYVMFAVYKYQIVPLAGATPQDISFVAAFVASIMPPMWFAVMFVGLILTMTFLVMSSFAQPRIPPLLPSFGRLAARWCVVLIAIAASLYVFDAASYIAPLVHQPMLCKYQYGIVHQESCLNTFGIATSTSATAATEYFEIVR
ncbi:hypothetical protein FJY93_03730 [Candidatus Kaiserbacteria bacterium]|nr:hypothetical protein [Candidatus Kaiserbacteria bacterium]